MLDCIVIDDEQPARVLIKEYIKRIPDLHLVGEYKNPLEAVSHLASKNVDLLFLDIQMPGLTGLEFIKTLTYRPAIILTTAYSEYALEGYELDVTDYLMKPIPFDRFLKAVNKLLLREKPRPEAITKGPEPLHIKADGQIHRVHPEEILFIEGLREYVTFNLTNRKIITLESLKKLSDELPADQFLRVHKSFIVNKAKIDSYSGHSMVVSGKKIPIGASYRDEVLERLAISGSN